MRKYPDVEAEKLPTVDTEDDLDTLVEIMTDVEANRVAVVSGKKIVGIVFKNKLEKLSASSHGLMQGIVVPSYVPIDSIAQLNQYKDKFDKKIIGIEPGAGGDGPHNYCGQL